MAPKSRRSSFARRLSSPALSPAIENYVELGSLPPVDRRPMTGEEDGTTNIKTNCKRSSKTESETTEEIAAGSSKRWKKSKKDGKSEKKTAEKEDGEENEYNSQPKTKADFSDYFRIFSYASTLDIVMLVLGGLAAVAAGVTLPLMNIVLGNLANNFNNYFLPNTTTTQAEFDASLDHQTLYLVYLFIAKFSLNYISMFAYRIVGLRVSSALRLTYIRSLFKQPVSVLDKQPPGLAATTITNSANIVQVGISEKLATFLQYMSLVIAAFIVAFTYNAKLAGVACSIFGFIFAIFSITTPMYIKMLKSMEHADEKAVGVASESIGAIRMIHACCAEERMKAKFGMWVAESRRRGLRMGPISGLHISPLYFAIYSNFALTFWYGVQLYNRHEIESVKTVIVCFFSIMMVTGAIPNIAGPVIAATKAASSAATFFEIIDSPTVESSGISAPNVSAHKNIVFKDVIFAYPSRPHVKILDSLNLTFESGKITAVVGPSGSGKSTIMGLLERWYELRNEFDTNGESSGIGGEEPVPISGSISIDGRELMELDLQWWRSQIGLVQQEPFLFNDTIFNNIAFGLVGSEWEHADVATKTELVKTACKEAFAEEFIEKLPKGYETRVGDNGIKLSGGQRQRLAIARSIIKKPTILILDEATSAIDVRAERIVQAALDRVSQNRTTITIAHRLSTIKKADKIVVLRKGVVVEEGTHESLLDEGGVYWKLVSAQQLTLGGQEGEGSEVTEEDGKEGDSIGDNKFETVDIDDEKEKGVARVEGAELRAKEAVKMPRGILKSFGVLVYEQRGHWVLYTLTLGAALVCSVGSPLQAWIMANVIAVFQETGSKLIGDSEHWALIALYLAIATASGWYVLGWSSNDVSIHVSSTYRQESFDRMVEKPIAFFDAEENSAGTLVSRVANDPTQLQQLLGTNLGFFLTSIGNLVGCIAIALAFGWKLALVGICSAMPIILIAAFMRVRFELQFERMNAEVFAESSQFAAESIGAFRTVSSLTLEDMICDRYSKLLDQHVRSAFMKARLRTLVFALSDSIGLLCMALTFWYGGRLLGQRVYDVTDFFVIYSAVITGSETSGSFASFGPNIAQAAAAANRILSLRPQKDAVEVPTGQLPPSEGGARLVFDNVKFKYPNRDMQLFDGLSLAIEKGQFAALVGASGCGKTSIISLLERFYDIQGGQITYNGTDIRTIDKTAYRKAISLVAQEPTLFQGKIRENIMLAVDEGSVTEEQLFAACKAAEIHDFILSLPEGYNTNVGSKGVALSGGQKQRIAIARALIRDPQILLLDEATSSLDSESEKLVQAAFERAAKGRTMVVIAHRLATVQNADVIFVLGEGGLLEKGNHAELLRKKGVYWQMCQSQALDR